MRKKLFPSLASAGLIAALATPASAVLPNDMVILNDWQFSDTPGTTSLNAVDSVGGSNFNADIHNSAVTADGVFKVQRQAGAENDYFAYAPISHFGASNTGLAWLVVDVAGWDFTSTFPRFRAALLDGPGGAQSTFGENFQLASVDLRPGDASGIGGFGSFGTANHVGYQGVITNTQTSTTPVRLVLQIDQDTKAYEVFYSFDNVTYTSIGAAQAETTWNVNYLGFGGYNNFTGEGMDVDRIFVATAIPEPSTYAAIFGGLALLGAFVYRRRVRK